MLDSYDSDNQMLTYHCNNPKCQYHNCKDWEHFRECPHHDGMQHVVVPAEDMRQMLAKQGVHGEALAQVTDTIITRHSKDNRIAGQSRTHHILHPGIMWTDPNLVALPVCVCGTQTFLKVNFTEEELNAPNIKIAHRDPNNPAVVTHFTQHPAIERHQQLAEDLKKIGKVYTPLDV